MPDYSKYTLEELMEAKSNLNADQYPEQGKMLEQLIDNFQVRPNEEEAPKKEIVWLHKPVSTAQQNLWLFCSITAIILLPLFFIGNYAPSYSSLHSYNGAYIGMHQTYNKNGVVLYDLLVGDRRFKVAGNWQKIRTIEPGSNVRVMSSSEHKVWEIRSGGEVIVSFSDFIQYAEKQESLKSKQALLIFISAIFGFIIYFKLKKHNKTLELKIPKNKE